MRNNLAVLNTYYQHKEAHKWTWYGWNSIKGTYDKQSQIDLFLSSNKNRIRYVKAIPSLSLDSDHSLVLIVWSFHCCTGKKLLPSHIWYQEKRNCIPSKMVKSPLRSCLGKKIYRAINQARFTHVLTQIYCERNHDSYSHN